MTKERRLGRGLEALLGRPLGAPGSAAGAGLAEEPATGSQPVNVYAIESNPFQPRRDFDDSTLAELAESIRVHGLLQPLVARRVGDRYQLISGERRLRAAIKAGWSEVPVIVREADDRQMAELAIVENLQRKDLNPLEKAASFQRYLAQFRCTQDELAARLGIDRSTVANLIRLLELPEAVQAAVRSGTISAGHARALLPLGDEAEQVAFCRRIETDSLSVRATETLVQDVIHRADGTAPTPTGAGAPKGKPRRVKSEHLQMIEQQLRGALGLKVEIRQSAGGRGKMLIYFRSHDEFARLRGQLQAGGAQAKAG